MFRQLKNRQEPEEEGITLVRMVDMLFEYAAEEGTQVTYKDVEQMTGVSWSNIRALREGENKNPSLRTLRALCDFFGIDLGYFNCRTEDECRGYLAKLAAPEAVRGLQMRSMPQLTDEGFKVMQNLQELIEYVRRIETSLIEGEEGTSDD